MRTREDSGTINIIQQTDLMDMTVTLLTSSMTMFSRIKVEHIIKLLHQAPAGKEREIILLKILHSILLIQSKGQPLVHQFLTRYHYEQEKCLSYLWR